MKSINSKLLILILVSCIIGIFMLTSCTSKIENNTMPDEAQVKSPNQPEALESKEIPEHIPNEAQVELAYKQAVEAYGWFDVTTMAINDSDLKEYNETVYYRVEHESIKNYADLKKYLQNLFTDDIVNQLLSKSDDIKHYIDIDGALYAVVADRGTDICKGDETYQIIYENDNKIICRVEVEVLDFDTREVIEKETNDFIYERLNNKWVFSEFYLVR